MTGPRNFVAEIKEGESHQPCFLFISLHADIGLGTKNIVIQMAKGTGIAEAARCPSRKCIGVRIVMIPRDIDEWLPSPEMNVVSSRSCSCLMRTPPDSRTGY
jgi:hypothetical protein